MASRRYAADDLKYAACSRFEKEGIGQLALIANIQIVLRFKLCFTAGLGLGSSNSQWIIVVPDQ